MSPEEIFKDKAVALAVQGVLLLSAVIYTTHGGPNIFMISCIATLLGLYFLQALNHRFRYYFPINSFFHKKTKKIDTYILYGLTFLAFSFFFAGLTHKFHFGLLLSLVMFLPGIAWHCWGKERVASNIESEFKGRDYTVSIIDCPFCGRKAVQVASFLQGNKALALIRCVEGCGKKVNIEPKVIKFG